MANLEELVVSLVAETSGLRAELANAAKATKDATSKMDDAIASFSENSGKNVGFFETAMATMTGFLAADAIKAVVNFAQDGIAFMVDNLKEGASSAIAQENALKRLANSLALSGQYSESAMRSLQGFTDEMEALTGVQDDVIASNLAVLSSLTKLDAEGLKKAQRAALDMSVALGMDLDSATKLVAKGIEGNVEMFKRYGITIQEGATKAETMKNVLDKLSSSFGGAAAGAAQTFGGAVLNLKNSFGNLNEALATTITKNPVVVAMLNQITKVFQELTSWVDANATEIRENLANALIATTKSMAIFAEVGDVLWRTMKAGVQGFIAGLQTIAGTVAWIGDKLGVIKDEDPFSGLKETSKDFNKTISEESALGKLSSVFMDIEYAGKKAYTGIASASDVATASTQNQKKAVEELSGKQAELYEAFAKGLADEGAALDSRYQYEKQLRELNNEEALIGLESYNAAKYEMMLEANAAEQEAMAAHHEQQWLDLQTARDNQKITETQFNEAKTALAQKQFLEMKKLQMDETKIKEMENKQREQNMSSTLSTIATLQQSSSKELQAIGKAAAIATATMDGIVAVQKALSAAPPPFNFALAALVGAATAVNISKIAGVGLNEGGTIAGGGANVDTVPASLTKGETVVSRDVTDKLAEFLNNPDARGGGNITVEISLKDSIVEFVEAKILERQAAGVSLLEA